MGIYDFRKQMKTLCKSPSGEGENEALTALDNAAVYVNNFVLFYIREIFEIIKQTVKIYDGQSHHQGREAIEKAARPYHEYFEGMRHSFSERERERIEEVKHGRIHTVHELEEIQRFVMKRIRLFHRDLVSNTKALRQACEEAEPLYKKTKKTGASKWTYSLDSGPAADTMCRTVCDDTLPAIARDLALVYKWMPEAVQSFSHYTYYFMDGTLTAGSVKLSSLVGVFDRTAKFCGIRAKTCKYDNICPLKEKCYHFKNTYYVKGPRVCGPR